MTPPSAPSASSSRAPASPRPSSRSHVTAGPSPRATGPSRRATCSTATSPRPGTPAAPRPPASGSPSISAPLPSSPASTSSPSTGSTCRPDSASSSPSDGRHWDAVAAVPDYWGPLFFSEHHAFLKVRRGRVQAIFPPVRARHLRILQTAAGARSWAARELFAYGPGAPRPPVPKPGELAAALRREGIRFVYANHWLSAWVRVDTREAIGALDANINVNDYSRTEPDPTELFPLRLEPGDGLLLGADADADGVRALLAGQPVAVRERQAGPYRLLALDPTPARRRLDKRGWRAGASDNAAQAARVIDGDRRTQWAAAGPASTVTLDVGVPGVLRGVEVRPGIPGRDLRLAASLDGAAWTDLSPVAWAGALYWTGAELLKNGGPKWAVAFPPTRLRYLRLSPAAPLAQPWAIAEIEALE